MSSHITLRQGIDRFYGKHKKYLDNQHLSEEAKEFFRCHDTAHVLFGCDTTIIGEGMVKMWTVFGTSLGFWKHIGGYKDADAFDLFRKYSWQHVVKNILRLLAILPKVIVRARRMKKPWPWSDFEKYMDLPIETIREEFNIQPIDYL